MLVATFYSFKGGVGRSMALANVAELLAQQGQRVVICDWDLEAPGLERFAVEEAAVAEAIREKPGILDLVVEYKQYLSAASDDRYESRAGDKGDTEFVQLENLRLRRPSSYLVPVRTYPGGGSLALLPAGRRGKEGEEAYARAVQSLDWNDFYERWGGASYLQFFRDDLASSGAQVVIIDSRTGVTEQGGVCTHDLADVVVLICGASEQNIMGTRWMADSLSRRELIPLRGNRPLRLIVAAARVDQSAEVELLGDFKKRFRSAFPEFAPAAQERESPDDAGAWHEIPYLAHYSFRESVVARAPETAQLGAQGMLAAYRLLAKAVMSQGGKPVELPRGVSTHAVSTHAPIARADGELAPETPVEMLGELWHRLRPAAVSTLGEVRTLQLGTQLDEAVDAAKRAERRLRRTVLAAAAIAFVLAVAAVYVSAELSRTRQELATLTDASRQTTEGLRTQLTRATQTLQEKALTAQNEVEKLTAASNAAAQNARATSLAAEQLQREAEIAAKKDRAQFIAAARLADDAKRAALEASARARDAHQAMTDAETTAVQARQRAEAAEQAAQQSRADLQVARQALQSERDARLRAETELALQQSSLQRVQNQLNEASARLDVCQRPTQSILENQLIMP